MAIVENFDLVDVLVGFLILARRAAGDALELLRDRLLFLHVAAGVVLVALSLEAIISLLCRLISLHIQKLQ